jgi:hypothetical protein
MEAKNYPGLLNRVLSTSERGIKCAMICAAADQRSFHVARQDIDGKWRKFPEMAKKQTVLYVR